MQFCSIQNDHCFSNFRIEAIRFDRDVQGIVFSNLLPDNNKQNKEDLNEVTGLQVCKNDLVWYGVG